MRQRRKLILAVSLEIFPAVADWWTPRGEHRRGVEVERASSPVRPLVVRCRASRDSGRNEKRSGEKTFHQFLYSLNTKVSALRGGFHDHHHPDSPHLDSQPDVARLAGDVPVGIPALGPWLRVMREHRDLTRDLAGQYTHVSAAYLKSVEVGSATPRRDTLDKIITGYELSSAQRRHTIELWEPAAVLAPLEELRERIVTPGRRGELATWDARAIACGFCDPLWNVVAANQQFQSLFPAWTEPRTTSPSGDSPRLTIRVARVPRRTPSSSWRLYVRPFGSLPRRAEGARLLRRLAGSARFAGLWRSGVEVAYDVGPSPRRWGDRDELVSVQVTELVEEPGVRLFLAYRSHAAGHQGADDVGAQPAS
ncbi:helix-turn-helix domain-containing protein [Nocardia africana]|uniref:helix-turn-helix domain-containing protein n=1 Tax=Nocardia africana TaxID=134964 RepID=UPI001D15648C|nr:helix-turn-helix transcriptional regulator [Nocardia africana]MCC3311350.1 helix-turn-helix transcriptional regulator [Nocardia africana]